MKLMEFDESHEVNLLLEEMAKYELPSTAGMSSFEQLTSAMNMFDAARAEGIQLQLNDGMRLSFSSGYVSQHTTGIAMDIGVTGENTICRAGADSVTGWGSPENAEVACKNIGGAQYAAYKWLQANAGKYGFHNLEVEPWHWSASGL